MKIGFWFMIQRPIFIVLKSTGTGVNSRRPSGTAKTPFGWRPRPGRTANSSKRCWPRCASSAQSLQDAKTDRLLLDLPQGEVLPAHLVRPRALLDAVDLEA